MKSITQVKCIVPFTLMMVNSRGYCYSCCSIWTKIGYVGRLTGHGSVMEIWNNERMQYIRQAILDDTLEKVCNFQYCPHAIKSEFLNLEAMKKDDPGFNHIIDQIMAGKTIMDNPPYTFDVANSGKCNLKCIMCTSQHKTQKSDDLFDEKLFTQIIPEILPGISKLFLSGNGEVFFNPHSRKFLQTLESNRYPSLKIDLFTNGTLFTPKLWETIRHNRYDCIYVSVDAASKTTYEKIRRNGNWEILLRNLKFISELRRQNVFHYFCLNFCVMKSNYREMKKSVQLGLELGCDKIFFQKVFGLADIRENINFTDNQTVFAEIALILADPIFSRPEVDTAQIDGYRKYLHKGTFFWNKLCIQGKESLLYFPIKAVFTFIKKRPWLYDLIHQWNEMINHKKVLVNIERR